MLFERKEPLPALSSIVKEYWVIEDEDSCSFTQKIIPDGYCEFIFHYGAPYRVNMKGDWTLQSPALFASQLTSHFFLENTGHTGILGVKLEPAAAHTLLGIDLSSYTDQVTPLKELGLDFPEVLMDPKVSVSERMTRAESWMTGLIRNNRYPIDRVDRGLQLMRANYGDVDIEALCGEIGVSRRHFEREFKKVVGLTPKRYCRIIRFNYIFEIMKNRDASWIDVALQSGHFDQSHFIKNFKEFTGEEPSQYGFNDQTIANFFLIK